ncbi:MAG: MarR family transcriptional regulator [Pseudomonadales bacterium]|nr:MarR family transcriptional regulator [Pseudomonadales bacterium]
MSTVKSRDLDTAFAFFNEIGIISQLSINQMQRSMPHGLTQSQFAVLNWFTRVDDEATPGRLASAFQVTKGAMTNTLTKLEDKGFIIVTPDPCSGRRKLVRISPAGRRAREAALAAASPQLATFLAAFPLAKLNRVLPLLRDVRQYLDTARENS